MESNERVYKFGLPTYTPEESIIRTKLKLGITLKSTDLEVISRELITKFGLEVSLNDPHFVKYLENKYPNIIISDELKTTLEAIKLKLVK